VDTKSVDIGNFNSAYFIGIGGIGMSALARYFTSLGWNVAGFDKTETPLTSELQKEGIQIHFEDDAALIPPYFLDKTTALIVYTPAIPSKNKELQFFKESNFTLLKRSEVLGVLTHTSKGLCVAGTHGKTTTSTLLAHVLNESSLKCNAFLGGISSNFNSNIVTSNTSPYTVIEADEFDRSFLQLSPFASIITSTDSDHLDIYGDANVMLEGFQKYSDLITEEGFLILKKGLEIKSKAKIITYSIEDSTADFYAFNIRFEDEKFLFDVKFNDRIWEAIQFGLPGIHNAENALSCIAFCLELGLSEDEIRNAFITFKGVKRRFEYVHESKETIYIDDYAHHPTEIKSLIDSVKLLYPNRKVTAVFQPHLFTRTRDFIDDFAFQLSRVDRLILLPIYPAREEPIEGVNSEFLLSKITCLEKEVIDLELVISGLKDLGSDGLLLTIGAGNIDKLRSSIQEMLENTDKNREEK
jgi:UDP-N-acetylmuramate--alanine ligase